MDADLDLVHFIIGLLTHPVKRQACEFLLEVTEFLGADTARVQLCHVLISYIPLNVQCF